MDSLPTEWIGLKQAPTLCLFTTKVQTPKPTVCGHSLHRTPEFLWLSTMGYPQTQQIPGKWNQGRFNPRSSGGLICTQTRWRSSLGSHLRYTETISSTVASNSQPVSLLQTAPNNQSPNLMECQIGKSGPEKTGGPRMFSPNSHACPCPEPHPNRDPDAWNIATYKWWFPTIFWC